MLTTDEANHYWCGLFIQNESFLRFFWKTTIIVNALCLPKCLGDGTKPNPEAKVRRNPVIAPMIGRKKKNHEI